jgi:choloylglycine hydrolase
MKNKVGFVVKKVSIYSCLFLICWAALPSQAVTEAKAPARACTSFCLDYADGKSCIFGANLDYGVSPGLIFVNKRNTLKAGWEMGKGGERAVWTSKYGSVTFNLTGFQSVWAGMNEAGLVISTMLLEETRMEIADSRPPLNNTVWLQYLLDTCSTVDEVIASDLKVRVVDGSDHYMVSDKQGNHAVIEFLNGKMVCHKGPKLPVKALTNDPYEECVRLWRSGKLYHNNYESLIRFGMAANLLKGFSPNPNMVLMIDKKEMVYYAFYILAAVAQPITCWSIVFDNRNLQVYFHTKLNPQMRQIDFNKLDFSGNTPVRMLDIHEPLAGDISLNFTDYSHDVCLKHLLFMIHYSFPQMPEQEVEHEVVQVLGFFEQFHYLQNTNDLQEQEMELLRKGHHVLPK